MSNKANVWIPKTEDEQEVSHAAFECRVASHAEIIREMLETAIDEVVTRYGKKQTEMSEADLAWLVHRTVEQDIQVKLAKQADNLAASDCVESLSNESGRPATEILEKYPKLVSQSVGGLRESYDQLRLELGLQLLS